MPTTFKLSDQSLNSHGFRVLTAGIDLRRFLTNPVMCYDHDTHRLPIGRWENLRVEGESLLADAVFDTSDPEAAEVARKVEEGFLRGCSISIYVTEAVDGELLPGQTSPTVTRCELMEASICPIGSNPGAVRLVAASGEPLAQSDTLTLSALLTNQNHRQMEKKELTLQEALQQLASKEADLTLLREENGQMREQLATLTAQLQAAHDQELQALVDAAVADGRIQASHADKWNELLHLAENTTRSLLQGLAPATSLCAQLAQHPDTTPYMGKDWRQLDMEGRLAAYKRDDPNGFRDLYRDTFGTDYIG